MSILDFSLEEVGGPTPAATLTTSLVEACRIARRKPIAELVPADLRVLLGQQLDVEFLLPLAIGLLNADPILDAEYYPGDLLLSAVRAANGKDRVGDWARTCLQNAVEQATSYLDAHDDEDDAETASELRALAAQLSKRSATRHD